MTTILIDKIGNVSYACPGFQAYVGIPAQPGCNNHTPGFTAVAGTRESHDLCLQAGKGMSISAWNILTDDEISARIWADFEADKAIRELDSQANMNKKVLLGNAGFC
jgi:hypothetical protein